MTDFMPESLTDMEVRLRTYIDSRVPAGMLYAYDFVEGWDCSDANAGLLMEQNADFYMFETSMDRTGRAGPSWVSPGKGWGTLDLSIFTKAQRDKVKYLRLLEAVAGWFMDDTVNGIRFRSFLPTPPAPVNGFTSYNGVINFEFEIAYNRS